ncbi:hypothetical protein V3C99_016488, partial [Haemonchus contortus]
SSSPDPGSDSSIQVLHSLLSRKHGLMTLKRLLSGRSIGYSKSEQQGLFSEKSTPATDGGLAARSSSRTSTFSDDPGGSGSTHRRVVRSLGSLGGGNGSSPRCTSPPPRTPTTDALYFD